MLDPESPAETDVPDTSTEIERTVLLTDVDLARFLGPRDRLITELEAEHEGVEFFLRDHVLTLKGPAHAVSEAAEVLEQLHALARMNGTVSSQELKDLSRAVRSSGATPTSTPTASQMTSEPILNVRGNQIRPQTRGQRAYVDAIDNNTVVFGIGPAGTGKTYLAMAKAVQALQRREVTKIILTRPAVEAGERLGFLPGSLEDKIDPYLRPLFDAIRSMLDPDAVPQLLANGTIEVAPLAYMRGRTLNESFVVLDEAQNTTPEQMKMFLTRLGFGSKMVVTGDITQIDVPIAASGLRLVTKILDDVDDLHFAYLTSDDIVRHSLVGRIIDAYATYEESRDEHQRSGKTDR